MQGKAGYGLHDAPNHCFSSQRIVVRNVVTDIFKVPKCFVQPDDVTHSERIYE